MPKYRKKPVEIEAVQLVGIGEDFFPMFQGQEPQWIVDAQMLPHDAPGAVYVFMHPNRAPVVHINTLEGCHVASMDDWIIRGVKGELYPCKPDIFEATYDRVFDPIPTPFSEHIAKDPDAVYLGEDMEVPPEWLMDKSVLDFASSMRDVALAQTYGEDAFMRAVRAVARPARINE